MKNAKRIVLLAFAVTLLFLLASCSLIKDPPWKQEDKDFETEPSDIVLIEDGKANFRIVYTPDAGSANVRRAGELVKQLRGMGIEIADPVSETLKNEITDCEIILGTGAKNRGTKLNIDARDLGKNGQIIKIEGHKILIAGGTPSLTLSLFESYIAREMNITDDMEALKFLAVDSEYSFNKPTDYRIDSIKIGGTDFKDFSIVYDIKEEDIYDTDAITKDFLQELYDISGYWFKEKNAGSDYSDEHIFYIRYTKDAGDGGFRVYYNGKDLIAECAYENAFERAFSEFAADTFLNSKKSEISLPEDFLYEKDVTVVSYKEFGARGDGISDDYPAILATHEYANSGGQKVIGSSGAVYYIDPASFTKTIEIRTDTDFSGATFIVDDRGEAAYANRGKPLFTLSGDSEALKFTVGNSNENVEKKGLIFDGAQVSIPSGTTSLEWIKPYVDVTSLVFIRNRAHRDYIRHGSNQNIGQYRHEVIVVNPDGSITDDTTVFFDYEKLTDITIWRGDDKPLTIENGNFYNVCCQAKLIGGANGGVTKYHAFTRGFIIGRANVTIQNLKHGMVDQPEVLSNKSDVDGSYPYGGFFRVREAYNLTVRDCELAGHVLYFEKKAATESANLNGDYNYVGAGSYDISFGDSSHITFDGVTQKNIAYTMDETTHKITETKGSEKLSDANYWGIGDNKYWGVMGSGNCKNLSFIDCVISRIDAHEGFFNVYVKDTVIGHTFHAVGGGTLKIDNMTRVAGNHYIITRGDYGGTFKGEMIIENGVLLGCQAYNSSSWYDGDKSLDTENIKYKEGFLLNTGYTNENDRTGTYWTWDFGYDCYMPETITLIGKFDSGISKIYISKNDYDFYHESFVPEYRLTDPDYRGYELIKRIVYQDWEGDKLPINKNAERYGTYNDYPEDEKTRGDYMASNCEIIEITTKKKQ